MKKTKKMQAGGLYFFKSSACSNTVYFEELDHAKIFLHLAKQQLKGFLYIHEFMLCKDGWGFLARLKSEKNIQKAYRNRCRKYGKLPKELPAWKIISEQMRMFLSEYVTKFNRDTGREGVLVKRPYERYYFETVKEAKRMIKRIRRRLVGLHQGKKMYRAKKGHYRIPKKLGAGGIYMSSKRRKKRGAGKERNVLDIAVFQQLKSKVLLKVIKKKIQYTFVAHSTPPPDS